MCLPTFTVVYDALGCTWASGFLQDAFEVCWRFLTKPCHHSCSSCDVHTVHRRAIPRAIHRSYDVVLACCCWYRYCGKKSSRVIVCLKKLKKSADPTASCSIIILYSFYRVRTMHLINHSETISIKGTTMGPNFATKRRWQIEEPKSREWTSDDHLS